MMSTKVLAPPPVTAPITPFISRIVCFWATPSPLSADVLYEWPPTVLLPVGGGGWRGPDSTDEATYKRVRVRAFCVRSTHERARSFAGMRGRDAKPLFSYALTSRFGFSSTFCDML